METNSVKIKNIAIIGFLVFLAVAIIYSLFWGPAKQFMDSLNSARTISVSAEGKIEAAPDTANFSFSVISESSSSETISEDNTNKMNAAIEFIKSKGVDEKDIKTTAYNLYPKYEYDKNRQQNFITGYTLTQTVSVKVRDLTRVAEVLGGLPALGINQIGSVSFMIDDQDQYLIQARDQAFEKAKTKAAEMASVNGTALGRIISFSDYQSPIYYKTDSVLGMGGGVASAPAPQIQAGTQEISVQVNIIYALK